MTENLYLVIERGRWTPRIVGVLRKRPELTRPSQQAIVKLEIELPDGILDVPTVAVQIRPEHIRAPKAVVTPAGVFT